MCLMCTWGWGREMRVKEKEQKGREDEAGGGEEDL